MSEKESPDAGHPLLQALVDSIEIVGGVACWDYSAMYDVRNALMPPQPEGFERLGPDGSHWALMCCDGCAVTFYTDEKAAIAAFSRHRLVPHRAILFAPGSFEMPESPLVGVSASIEPAKEAS